MIKIRTIVGLFAAAAISTAATGQMSLDLNASPGDQGEREKMVKPGEAFAVELIAIGGATGQIGFTVELKFDTNQVHFKSFNAGGLMAGTSGLFKAQAGLSIVANYFAPAVEWRDVSSYVVTVVWLDLLESAEELKPGQQC